jgi:hypothetical protein
MTKKSRRTALQLTIDKAIDEIQQIESVDAVVVICANNKDDIFSRFLCHDAFARTMVERIMQAYIDDDERQEEEANTVVTPDEAKDTGDAAEDEDEEA